MGLKFPAILTLKPQARRREIEYWVSFDQTIRSLLSGSWVTFEPGAHWCTYLLIKSTIAIESLALVHGNDGILACIPFRGLWQISLVLTNLPWVARSNSDGLISVTLCSR